MNHNDQALKIISLEAENVLGLKAVDINPDGDLVIVGGKNAAGKSSVLDSIWLALGGRAASKATPMPIREGETRASVRLDLGDLIVTRTWTPSGSRLKVENGDGATFSSPQTMLDALVGQLSFDPLAFTRLSPKEQREALLDLVDVDLESIDSEITGVYAERTSIGRQGKAIGDVTVDDDLPPEETSAVTILNEIQAVEAHNRKVEEHSMDLGKLNGEAFDLRTEIDRLQKQLADIELSITEREKKDVGEIKSLDPLRIQLETVEETNAKIRANNAARERKAEQDRLREKYESLTDRLTELDEQKAAALAAAKFPVHGLSFDDSGVLYQGLPLSQASSAEQIRVSLAMGMALNPRLKVLMIKDGSLLDADSLEAIHKQVADKGFQLWLEIVDPDDPSAVIIEDGEVAK